MSSPSTDPYKALGVERNADVSAIKTAYRKLVLKCHPDKVQDPALKATKQDEFQRVQQAYEILSDEARRREYDEDAKLKKLREELSRGMARPTATSRSSPKTYEPHIRTAEPPPSFKPGPPPTSPYSPYGSASHQFSHSWDIPLRGKAAYEEGHHARRTASYEKPRDDLKEERRRRKDDDEFHDWGREKDRERERERERERDRDRDRERKSRPEREKDDKKEKARREMDKREKERDRARRHDQQEKYRTRKPAYVEEYGNSDGDHHVPKKKSSAGIAAATTAGGNGKKHIDSPRRDKSARRDESPQGGLDDYKGQIKAAADYIGKSRGSKPGGASQLPEGVAYSSNYPDPEHAWRPPGDASRIRRPSQDEKKLRTRIDADDGVRDNYETTHDFIAPRLAKSYTSPAGTLHMSNSSAPRVPNLSRATTMDYSRHLPPEVPAVPTPDLSHHSRKSERRRRGSFNTYDGEVPRRRTSVQPHISHYDDPTPLARTPTISHYRSSEGAYYDPPMSTDGLRRPVLSKVKVSPSLSRGQVYEAKRFSDDDVAYSPHVAHASYLGVRS